MPRSEALQRQWALYDNKQYGRAFAETMSLLEKLSGADLRDAQRLLGLASLRQRQYPQASLWLKKACQGSDDSSDWLELATSAALQGHLQLSAEAFEQVRLIQQVAKYQQGPGFYRQLLWYASALCDAGEHDRLRPLLDEVAQAYRRIHDTDSTLLYILNLPFLSSILALAVRHFDAAGKRHDGLAWLQALGQALDHEGREQVAQARSELQQPEGPSPSGDG
jgi:tetratricopeptide (TPR) repeat protein